jgi:enamine deaminase RidA (YjgF/YER057c/UK114 family)
MRFASPSELPAPHGYSQVVCVPVGTQVWVSGQIGMDPSGAVPDGMEAQARLAFANVGRALEAAGATWADVFKLTTFITDMGELATVRAVRESFVNGGPPTSTLVAVSALVLPELLIEIEAVASIEPRYSRP